MSAMTQRFLKITTGTGEQRWINLDRVTRVSLATDSSGEPVLVFCFDGQDRVAVHGNDDAGRSLIREISGSLDAIANPMNSLTSTPSAGTSRRAA